MALVNEDTLHLFLSGLISSASLPNATVVSPCMLFPRRGYLDLMNKRTSLQHLYEPLVLCIPSSDGGFESNLSEHWSRGGWSSETTNLEGSFEHRGGGTGRKCSILSDIRVYSV